MVEKPLVRVGYKLRKLLADTKQKNGLKSLGEAGERVADYLNGIDKKKTLREKIIREIEF
jgi:hypothetical protein